MKKYALQQQIIARQRKLMDSINQNTMTPNIHPQLQSNLQMRLPTSVPNGVQKITPQVNGAPKKTLFQPPPPTTVSLTEPTQGDIEIDTEAKKNLLEVNSPRVSELLRFRPIQRL